MNKDCLFCNIAEGVIPSKKVHETQYAFAFLDINPVADGHTVIVPKNHVSDISVLPDAEIGPLFTAVKEVTMLLKSKLGTDHFTIGINHGEAAGQLVPHLHVHVIPRYQGDGGGSIHSVIKNPKQKESLEVVYNKIISK